MISKKKLTYGGWPNCIRLTDGKTELVVTTDVGPRVIRYARIGEENVLKEVDAELGKTGGNEWRSYGGHRLWHAPEAIPRTYAPDNAPVAASWRDGVLTLTLPKKTASGARKLTIN